MSSSLLEASKAYFMLFLSRCSLQAKDSIQRCIPGIPGASCPQFSFQVLPFFLRKGCRSDVSLSVSPKLFLTSWTNRAQSDGRRQISKGISNFLLLSSAPAIHFHGICHVPTDRKTALPAQPYWKPEVMVRTRPPGPWGSPLHQFC